MTTMIERVARAIATAERLDPDGAVMVGMKTMRAWESRLPHAHAAISAMREPTQEMREAATDIAIDTGRGGLTALNWEEAESVWQAMVDAALTSGDEK